MRTRCRTRIAGLPPRRAAATALLSAALILACGGEPAAPQAKAQVEAPAPVHDALRRPQLFRDAFAELKARPELAGHELKVFQYVFFHDDGTVMLKVQNPQRPGQLDHYEYRPAGSNGRPTPAWDGPHVFARDRDPTELAPQLIRLDEVPLQALPAVDETLDRQLEWLKALHPEQRENLELADGDRSIYFVVGGSDGERRWESKVNALYAWPMSAYRVGFSPEGSFYILEEIPPPR